MHELTKKILILYNSANMFSSFLKSFAKLIPIHYSVI